MPLLNHVCTFKCLVKLTRLLTDGFALDPNAFGMPLRRKGSLYARGRTFQANALILHRKFIARQRLDLIAVCVQTPTNRFKARLLARP